MIQEEKQSLFERIFIIDKHEKNTQALHLTINYVFVTKHVFHKLMHNNHNRRPKHYVYLMELGNLNSLHKLLSNNLRFLFKFYNYHLLCFNDIESYLNLIIAFLSLVQI